MNEKFNKLIVDSPEVLIPDTGRILNVFTDNMSVGIAVEKNLYLRIFDINLRENLNDFPLIISNHIDLSGCEELSHSAGLAIEVANKQDIVDASGLAPDLLIAKSFEAPGVAKECSALILYQLLIEQDIPFSIHANTGYELFQSYLSTGVHGIVLPLKYLQEDETTTLRFHFDQFTSLRIEVDGGPPKAHIYQRMLTDKGWLAFVEETYQLGLWEKPFDQEKSLLTKQKIHRYNTLAGYKNFYVRVPRFYPDAPAAQALKVRLPIVQGPMSGITMSADFAQAVYQSGAFPFLALASLSNDDVEKIVSATAAKNISFGVGIVAVSLSDKDFDVQIKVFEKYKPTLVLVGTPQLNHIQRLLKTHLKIAVHAPNRALFKALYKMGVRCFVIEGGEAGGHISTLGSLTAWQEILNEVRAQSLQDKVQLILAGGIRGNAAKDLITALIYFYGFENSLKVSLQLGTVYQATKEALTLTKLSKGFQEQLFNVNDTFVTGESLSRGVRQLAIKNSAKTVIKEWRIFASDLSHEDKKQAYEKLYRGGLQLAISSEKLVETGSYMAGSVSALLDHQLSLNDIHHELIDPVPEQTNQAQEPIAIVGIGLKLPGAESVEEHFYNIFHQRCFITDLPEGHFDREIYLSEDKHDELTSYTALGAFIDELDDDLSRYRIPPIIARQLSKSQKMALDTAHKALQDAGYFEKPFNKERTGVIIGSKDGSNNIESLNKINWPEICSRLVSLSSDSTIDLEELCDAYAQRYINKEITEDTLPGELGSIVSARVASVFDFKGGTHTVDAACASSLAAIAQAMCLLRNHSCDVVLAGGIEERMGQDSYIKFSRIGALSENGCFSFDSKADGFVMGEGGGIYVLKRYADALKFGDKIYAVINGWGASSDGAGKGITAPSKEGQILAVKRAFQDARLPPSLVDYIECHATATKVGDSTELAGLSEFLQDRNANQKPVLGASKAMIGHLRTAAGAAGILQSLFVINSRYFPATINFQKHSHGDDLPFDVLKLPVKVGHDNKIVSSVSSFGFGGANYHLILSSPDENSSPPVLSEQQMDLPVYDYTGDLAWICPGQGSQYEGMLAAYKNEPDFMHLANQAADIFIEYSQVDLIRLITEVDSAARDKNEVLLKSTEVSQPAIFFSSAVIGRKLLTLGIKPDLLIGHSLGEYSALCLAGVLSFAEAFRLVCIRGQLMSADLAENAGAMIAIMGNEMLAEKLIKQTPHYAVCANLNSYNQTVISCSGDAVDELLKAADKIQVRATPLKVARGFHSRFVSACVDEMTRALESCQFYYPSNRVSANIKNQAYPYYPERCKKAMNEEDRNKTIALLKRQIDHPVHFISQIQSAYASGIRRFVEVGPNNILTRLVEQINQGKYLQTVYLNKLTEDPVDLASLSERLQEELVIKRIPLPKSQAVQNKPKLKNKESITANKRSLIDEIRTVVADISGYEIGSFDDNAEFERDLGIDTLKIFEILAQLRGQVLPQELGNFRELNSVNKILANCPQQAQQNDSEQPSPLESIREIVASISGYELDTLDDNAEFERDLGIDTLKIFEIIAQLRGSVLPGELTDFRNLNTIQKLYTARDKSNDTIVEQSKSKKDLFVYKYKEHFQSNAELLSINIKEYDIFSDNGHALTATKSDKHLLIFKAADSADDLRNRVYKLLYEKCSEFIEEKARTIIIISYGSGALKAASVLSVSAFIRSLDKDYSDADWHYSHFDQLPDIESLSRRLYSGIGLKCLGDKVVHGKLQKMQGFQSDIAQLPTLITSRDHIIVTGGARGIAAHLVKQLYANCAARFTLIGRKQECEAWIQELDPSRINYISLDISEQSAVQEHRENFSDCTMLIHSAGIDYSKNFKQKTADEFFEVIDVKVAGLFNLLACLNEKIVRALVLFSSTAGYWGNHGQTDYAAANGVLNSRIKKFPCLSFGWTAWDEVGMASKGLVHDILTTKGARFIGLNEGSEIFQKALAAFLDNPYAAHSQLVVAADFPEQDPLYCSEMDGLHSIDDLDKSIVIKMAFDSQQFPELLDHRYNGKIFVPGSVLLGSVLHEIHKKIKLDDINIEFEEVEFLSPLIVENAVPTHLKITRREKTFLVEEIKEKLTWPIFTFTVKIAVENRRYPHAKVKDRYENSMPGLTIGEQSFNRKHSELGANFQILDSISFSQGIIRTKMDLHAGNVKLLQRLFAVSKALEACSQSCSTAVNLLKNPKQVYLPSSMERAFISFKALRNTAILQIYIELLDKQSKGASFNILAINEHGEQVITLNVFELSPVLDVKIADYYILKNTPIKDAFGESFIADIAELNQQFGDKHHFTANELSEIDSLISKKRKDEKKSGKLACKILTNWHSLNYEARQVRLCDTEVLSTEQPVQVLLNGKPDAAYPFYSISHSDGIVFVHRSANPNGVDIEKIRPLDAVTIKSIYGNQRHAAEKYLRDGGIASEYQSLFPLILFTQKEAALKAHGIGLANGMDLAVIERFSANHSLIVVNGKKYSIFSYVSDDFVVSKAFLFAVEQTPQNKLFLAKKTQRTKFQQTFIKEEKLKHFSYSLNHTLEFKNAVDVDKLSAAINWLLKEHEVLRSRFPDESGTVLIAPFEQLNFAVVKSTERLSVLEDNFIYACSNYQYDIQNEALYRFKLYQSAEGATLLLMNFHHLILDCFNAFILSSAILGNYKRLVDGESLVHGGHKQYYDLEIAAAFSKGATFWHHYLSGIDAFNFDKPQNKETSKGKHFKTITLINKQKVEQFCRAQSVTLFAGLLGVLKLTFLKLYDKKDLLIFIPFSGKNSQNHETLGSFIHLIPVRSKIENSQNHEVLFKQLKENLYTAIEHQNEQLDTTPIANNHGIITQLINSGEQGNQFIEGVERRNTDGKNTNYPLIISFINFNDEIHVDITFDRDIVSENQLNEILDCFKEELTAVISSSHYEKLTQHYTPPRSPTEEALAVIWAQVLQLDQVGRQDNFFALGGHSLLATQIIARIQENFQLELPLLAVFENPVLADLANVIKSTSKNVRLPAINKLPADAPKVLSFAQEWMWVLSQYDAQSSTHTMSYAWRCNGNLDLTILRKALYNIVDRQQSLRLYFPQIAGQVTLGELPAYDPLTYIDITEATDAERVARLERLRQKCAQQTFALDTGPLFKVNVVKTAEQEHVLLLAAHHIIFDHWSMGVLLQELQILYTAYHKQQALHLPELSIQYTDYTTWQRTCLQDEILQWQVDYWLNQLQDAPELLNLPTDYPRPETQKKQGGRVDIQISKELSEQLTQLAQEQGCSLHMVLFSGLVLLLHRFSGQDDICVGIPLVMRHQRQTESLVGLFLNMLVLRSRVSGQDTFTDLLKQVRKNALDAYAHKDVPFGQLVNYLNPQRQAAYNPYFQVMFNLLNTPNNGSFELPDLQIESWHHTDEAIANSNLDIFFTLRETNLGIAGRIVFDTALFKTQTIHSWVEGYIALLTQAVSQPETVLNQFSLTQNATARYPLTSSQREIWFDQMLHASFPLYNIGGYIKIPGQINPLVFEQAVNLLIKKHHTLRTLLLNERDEEGIPLQTYAPSLLFKVPLHDFSKQKNPHEAALAWMQTRFVEPFELTGQPLFRYGLIKINAENYYWLLQYHHLIVDGHAVALLNRSLAEIYTQLIHGQTPELASPSYVDFIDNDRHYVESEIFEKQRQYWLQKYPPPPEPLLSPRYRSHDTKKLVGSGCEVLYLPREFYQRLQALANQHKASLFHLLLSALYIYFTRTAQRDDFAIGLPVLNRGNANFKKTAGLFTSVSPALFNFGKDISVAELWRQINKTLKANYRHQRFPVSEINRAVGLGQERSQLFDISLSYENHDNDVCFAGIDGQLIPLLHHYEQVPLMVFVRDFHIHHDVELDFVFNRAYFKADEIKSLQARLVTILEAILEDCCTPIHALPVMTKRENQQLQAWNNTAAFYPKELSLIDLLQRQVEKTPDHSAVVFEEQTLSYRQLNDKANQLANYLLSIKTPKGAQLLVDNPLIAIAVERSMEMIIGILGIIKAGGAYVPIDPSYPAARIHYMLGNGAAPLLLTQSHLQAQLPLNELAYDCAVVCLDKIDFHQQSAENPSVNYRIKDLTYVIYTSGSTGKPKGVCLPQSALINLLQWQNQQPGLDKPENTLQFTSMSFDVSFQEIFSTFIHGGELVLVDEKTRRDPDALLKYLSEKQIERMFVPFVMLQYLAEQLMDSHYERLKLRNIITAGEQLRITPAIFAMFNALPQCRLHNHYGPTESHVVTAYTLPLDNAIWEDYPAIGQPVANTRIYILDGNHRPLPVSVPGELCIAGACLAEGYLNRPELTIEKFIDIELFGKTQRIYKTGDMACWLPDGKLDYLGRIDQQIKLRGYRIEPGEIESVLAQHAEINEVIVTACEEQPGIKRLVAYLTHIQKERPSVNELRIFLKEKLPEYMIPSAFVFLEKFPLTPNGKLDRSALPSPDKTSLESESQYVAPRTTDEKILADIWRAVLNVDRIGIHDNFFELGGHSLLAVSLCSKIEAKFNKPVPLELIFQFPTVSQFYQAFEEKVDSDTKNFDSIITAIQTTGSQPPFFWLHGGKVVPKICEHIGEERPFYLLNHQSLDGKKAKYLTVSEMANYYIQAIYKIDAKGPYYLGGYSIGGLVIYEIARQLCEQGKKVAFLFLLDPSWYNWGKNQDNLLSKQNTNLLDEYKKLKKIGYITYFLSKSNPIKEKLHNKLEGAMIQAHLSLGKPLPSKLIWPYQSRLYNQASANFQPKNIAEEIDKTVLIQTKKSPSKAWANMVKETIYTIDAAHLAIIEKPYALEWINILAQELPNSPQRDVSGILEAASTDNP